MKAIINTGPDQLNWLDWPLPVPKPGEVRIRTGACGICATDLHMIAGWPRTGFPSIPGHEWAGTIDTVGENVAENLIGQHCVGENVLSNGGEVGFEFPGGYGEYLITEAKNLYLLPDLIPITLATLMEPLAVAVRAVRKLRLDNVDTALIMGDGPIGLLVLMLMHYAGMKNICMVGGRDPHLRLAMELGAVQIYNYHGIKGDPASGMVRAFGQLFPIVVEASGSSAAMQASLELVQKCGHVLILGDYGSARAGFEWNHVLHQEIELIGSNASAGAWPEAVHLAASGDLPLNRLITQRLPASRFRDGVELTRSRNGDVIKVVLEWNE